MDTIFLYITLGALILAFYLIRNDRKEREKKSQKEAHERSILAKGRMID